MEPKTRELFLRVVGQGFDPIHEITAPLYFLECNMPVDRLHDGLRYLIRNKISGHKFVDWYRDRCFGSMLEMQRELTRVIENERHTRKLFVGDMKR